MHAMITIFLFLHVVGFSDKKKLYFCLIDYCIFYIAKLEQLKSQETSNTIWILFCSVGGLDEASFIFSFYALFVDVLVIA